MATESATDRPVLYYFGVRALGWPAQLMFAAGDVDFEYKNIGMGEWYGPNTPKTKAKFGQMPFIEYNGQQTAQSCACERLAAEIAGLRPDNMMDRAHCDEVYEQCRDISTKLFDAKYAGENSWKDGGFVADDEAQKEAFGKAHEVAMQKLEPLEKMLAASKSGWFVNKASYADVRLYATCRWLNSSGCTQWAEKYPQISAHFEAVPKLGSMQKYMDEEKVSDYCVQGSHKV